MTSVKLDLISDIEMSQFIRKGMRGGVSYIAQRYSNNNNKYVKSYDKNKLARFYCIRRCKQYAWMANVTTYSFWWIT